MKATLVDQGSVLQSLKTSLGNLSDDNGKPLLTSSVPFNGLQILRLAIPKLRRALIRPWLTSEYPSIADSNVEILVNGHRVTLLGLPLSRRDLHLKEFVLRKSYFGSYVQRFNYCDFESTADLTRRIMTIVEPAATRAGFMANNSVRPAAPQAPQGTSAPHA